jgi:hypothetical protein
MTDRKTQYWEWCAKLTDSELCDRMAIAIEEQPEAGRSWPHTVVYRLWSFQGFTRAEGLAASMASCFFESVPLAPIAEGYDVIGLPAHAEIVWKLASIAAEAKSADESQPGEISLFQESDDFISFVSERLDLSESEEVFFDRDDDFVSHLAVFVRSHLTAFESLEFKHALPERSSPNVGYLSSILSWVVSYAHEHNEIAPTLSQLSDHCMHDGIKRATGATHTILLKGPLPKARATPVARYHRTDARNWYVITLGGNIIEEPNGDKPPDRQTP